MLPVRTAHGCACPTARPPIARPTPYPLIHAQVESLQSTLRDAQRQSEEVRGHRDVLRQQLLRSDERATRLAGAVGQLEGEVGGLGSKLAAAAQEKVQMNAKLEAAQVCAWSGSARCLLLALRACRLGGCGCIGLYEDVLLGLSTLASPRWPMWLSR